MCTLQATSECAAAALVQLPWSLTCCPYDPKEPVSRHDDQTMPSGTPFHRLMQLQGEPDRNDTALLIHTVLQFKRAGMRLCNLTREHQSDTAARWLCCIEGNKSVARIHQARPIILNR